MTHPRPAAPATTATAWLRSIGPKLAEFRAQDRAATLASIPPSDRDAELMRSLVRCRYVRRTRLTHWELAFIGLSFVELYGDEALYQGDAMAADQAKHGERHGTGCRPSWD